MWGGKGAEVVMRESLPPTQDQERLYQIRHILEIEKQTLGAFFGHDILVVEPPAELFQTQEALLEHGITGFEPHFLPQVSLTEKSEFPGWKVRPDPWFWKQIRDGRIPADAATLREGWYLVDGRTKPDYDNGQQRYSNDYMEPIMQGLRKTGKIQKHSYVPDISRFGASPEEIENIILPEFTRIINTRGEMANKRYIELNVLGNMFHPEWGRTNTLEWFADKLKGNKWLGGGRSDLGGLANVDDSWSDFRDAHPAFSPVIRFPSGNSPVVRTTIPTIKPSNVFDANVWTMEGRPGPGDF